MRHYPSYEEFVNLAQHATLVPVYRQLIGDTLTPVTAFCKIQEGEWSFLFESVIGGGEGGRSSFLGAGPLPRFPAHGTHARIPTPLAGGARRTHQGENPPPP